MINRVDGQHNYTNPYERQKRKSGRVEADAPAFLLDYDEKGVVWEREGDKQKGQIPKDSAASKEKRDTVKKQKAVNVAEKEAESTEEKSSAAGSFFQNILKGLRGLLQGFLQLVWYSGEEEKKTEDVSDTTELAILDEESIEPDLVQADGQELSEEEEDRKLRELIAKKDNKAFMDTLTRGNRRKPARNTSILTSYDRHGRLVKPEEAEAGRLLHHENAEKENVTVRKQGTYRKYI